MAKKMDLGDFVVKLNRIIGHDPSDRSTPEIEVNFTFNECSCRGLLEGNFYVCGLSTFNKNEMALQKKVKERISEYVKTSNLGFIVTEREFCQDNECHGHYVDPFKPRHRNHIFVNSFPENINGTYVHFLTEKNFKIYKQIVKN